MANSAEHLNLGDTSPQEDLTAPNRRPSLLVGHGTQVKVAREEAELELGTNTTH
jgi:hypothetical protein